MSLSIAQTIDNYLGMSETFIYEYLIHIHKYKGIVLTNKIQNRNLFPYPHIITTQNIKRFSYWRLRNNIDYRLQSNNGYFEYISFCKYQLKKNSIQLIHAHFGPVGFRMLPLKKALHIPLITTFYGYDVTQLPCDPQWHENYQQLFEKGEKFLVEGSVMKNKLMELGCPSSKINIQKIGIDIGKYPYQIRKKKDKIIFLFCGRFVEKKGLIYALKAFAHLSLHYKKFEFRIIGDGEMKREITQCIFTHKLHNQVKLLGMLPHRQTIDEMKKADVLIQPSITSSNGDTEGGAPTIILEAQAMGMLIISTVHADIPHIVAEPLKKFLVAEKDWKSLVKVVEYFIHNENNWAEFSTAGRTFVEKYHDIKKLAPQLEKRYASLI